MNSIAQRALASAFGKGLPAPTGHPAPPLPQIVITGPINCVMELEGKRYAVDFVQNLGASIRNPKVVAKAIADLTRYAAQQPASYASGVKIIIDLLKGAS